VERNCTSKGEKRKMTKDEMKNRISMALKDQILQQGFEIICKENAELRKFRELLAVGSKLNKGLISRNKFLEEEQDKYRNMVFDKIEQLDKAKELLAKWVELFKTKSNISLPIPIQVDTEQFLKDE
jgi:hypothetical protein